MGRSSSSQPMKVHRCVFTVQVIGKRKDEAFLLPCTFDFCGLVKTGSVGLKDVLWESLRKQTLENKHEQKQETGGGHGESVAMLSCDRKKDRGGTNSVHLYVSVLHESNILF